MYSIHAPGLPALALPAFAVAGYRGVVVFLVVVSAAGCALAWWLAWRLTGNSMAAWFGWAIVVFAAPFLLESYTVFPDGPAAVLVLTGFWALLRAGWEREGSVGYPAGRWWPWALHGVALALLPWMHTRLAVVAGTLGGLILVRIARTPNAIAKAVAFLTAPAAGALAWLFFFTIVYGAPDPSAPYGGRVENSFAFLPNGLGGILFDQGFGLLATAPAIAVAFAGFTRTRRFALEWAIVAIPYLLSVTTFAMWWAGASGPARFLVPLLLPLAIPAACAWSAAKSRGARCVLLAALIVSAWMAAVMAGGGSGQLGYHTRNTSGLTAAPWLEWASPVVNLPFAFPAFVPQPVQPDPGGRVSRANAARAGMAATLPWLLCLGGTAALLVWGFKRWRVCHGIDGRHHHDRLRSSRDAGDVCRLEAPRQYCDHSDSRPAERAAAAVEWPRDGAGSLGASRPATRGGVGHADASAGAPRRRPSESTTGGVSLRAGRFLRHVGPATRDGGWLDHDWRRQRSVRDCHAASRGVWRRHYHRSPGAGSGAARSRGRRRPRAVAVRRVAACPARRPRGVASGGPAGPALRLGHGLFLRRSRVSGAVGFLGCRVTADRRRHSA